MRTAGHANKPGGTLLTGALRPAVRRTVAAVLVLLAPAVLAGCGVNSGPGQFSMTLVSRSWNPGIAPVAVAIERGYFEAEGLDPNVLLVDSATTQATQISSGNARTGALSPEPMFVGRQPGKDVDLTYYMDFYHSNIYGLAVPTGSPIRAIRDLAGKTVGATSLSSVSVTQAKAGLERAGVDPDSVNFIAIGNGGQQALAVENGDVDAVALLDTSFEYLKNQGIALRDIEVPGTENLTSGGLAARTGDLARNPEFFEKVGRAVAKGAVFSAANPGAAVRILYEAYPEARPSGLNDTAAVAAGVGVLNARLANLGVDALDGRYGELDPTMLAANEEFLRSTGTTRQPVDVNSLYTNDLIDAINDFDIDAVRAEAARL